MRIPRTTALVTLAAVTSLCTACVPVDVEPPAPAASSTPTEMVTDEPLDGIDIGLEPTEVQPLAEGETDVTAELQDAAGLDVTRAVYDGDTLRIDTWIVDPRGPDGSPAARDALDVCEAARELGYERVYVAEDDGTSFVVAGHSSYGPVCTEV